MNQDQTAPAREATGTDPGGSAGPSIEARVADAQEAWKAEAKAFTALASSFAPLANPATYHDLSKLPGVLGKVEQRLASLPIGERGAGLLDEVRADLDERVRRMRENLARELKAECEAQGLELRVVRREEPIEVRIPPLAVSIDREKGSAELRFARLPLASCEATAGAIVESYRRVLDGLQAGFQPERFFDACLGAWRAALGAGSGGAGERVEITDFLPYLALQLQSPAFRVEPSERNYRGYSRARFAFDLMRLRKELGLGRDGMRLNLGVATGTTATKKNRTLFCEDEYGDGEFKLTVFFTRAGGS